MKKVLSILAVIVVVGAVIYYFIELKPEKEVQTVRIGMVTFPGYAPFYLANDKGFFEDVNVELLRIEAIGDIRAAMNSGKIDMYIATHDIFQAIENQEPPGIGFLAVDESFGADGIAVTDNIKNIADLKGLIVGAEPGLPPYFILQYLLNKENMTLEDIDFRDISSQDAGNAFVANRLDAVGTYEPYLSKSVELRPNSKVLVSSADLNGLIVDIVFASKKLINENPEILEKVADGWFRAVDYYEGNKDESMKIMGKAFGVSKEEMIDIKSGLSWLNKSENIQLFDKSQDNNLFSTFDLIGEILVKNNANVYRVYSQDKLTTKLIDNYSK